MPRLGWIWSDLDRLGFVLLCRGVLGNGTVRLVGMSRGEYQVRSGSITFRQGGLGSVPVPHAKVRSDLDWSGKLWAPLAQGIGNEF